MPDMVTAQTNIDELLERYPQVASVFLKYKLLCVGCPISHHHMISDCGAENPIDVDALLSELNAAVAAAQGEG